VRPTAQNSGRTAGRIPLGRRFEKGISGNPGGRPRGSKTYAIRLLVAEALNDPKVWQEAVERYRETLKTRKTVISGLEFAARVNREIGIGANDEIPGGVTIIFQSNLRPGALGRLKNPNRPTLNLRPERRGRDRKEPALPSSVEPPRAPDLAPLRHVWGRWHRLRIRPTVAPGGAGRAEHRRTAPRWPACRRGGW
jgi:Family of unknown function (DUF5681)